MCKTRRKKKKEDGSFEASKNMKIFVYVYNTIIDLRH